MSYKPPVSTFYGADRIAAEYCGFSEPPSPPKGFWHHGWVPQHLAKDPVLVTNISGEGKEKESYWVSRMDEEAYLKQFGYHHVKAIGLPVIYLRNRGITRIPGTLLIMPGHSLPETTHSWRLEEYAKDMDSIRSYFRKVTVCVHPSCIKKGYWSEQFRARGFEVIQALDTGNVEGDTPLCRMQRMLSSVEFMTTNNIGSHVAYAAYFGAKVSVFGEYASLRQEDYSRTPFYVMNPQILPLAIEALSEPTMRCHYPHLFCHPLAAKEQIDWGRRELGQGNKITPREMRKLFGWRIMDLTASRIRECIPSRIKHWGKLLCRPDYRRKWREKAIA